MPIARKFQVNDATSTVYHCISRCVRRAHLCGDKAEHRREWVRELIKIASGAFAVDTLAYAVMGNHLHVVLRTQPGQVADWSDDEVVARWARAHPRTGSDGSPIPWSDSDVASHRSDARCDEWTCTFFNRRMDMHTFHKLLN